MERWRKILDAATNLAILGVCILIAVIGVKKFLLPGPSANQPSVQVPAKGSRLQLAGMDWTQADRTVVLVLSTQCHFCTDSAGFYRKLVPEAATHRARIVAVLPQPPEEGRQYLAGLGLPGIDVQQSPLDGVQSSGTPTLIVVDRQGRVQQAWAGRLPPKGEAEVLAVFR